MKKDHLNFSYNFPGSSLIKIPPANAEDSRDKGWILGLLRSPEKRNGYPLQYSCLENSMDRGAWRATVHGVTKLDVTEWLAL